MRPLNGRRDLCRALAQSARCPARLATALSRQYHTPGLFVIRPELADGGARKVGKNLSELVSGRSSRAVVLAVRKPSLIERHLLPDWASDCDKIGGSS